MYWVKWEGKFWGYNNSDYWKSTWLGKKSTVVNIQSNFKIFGQHQHFEVLLTIWSRVDHESLRKALKSSKVKSCQIRVSFGKVNSTLTKHNFVILYEKWPIQSSLLRVCNFLQSIFTPQYQEMHSQEVTNLDIIGQFWKSTKTPFLPKLRTWAWNIKMWWYQKGWL